MCIRDKHRNFVIARTDWLPYCLPVFVGEAMGLFRAIHWVRDLDLPNVNFELDCQAIVNSVTNPKEDISEFGVVVRACYDLLLSFPNFGVSHIRRQANSKAHRLARATLFLDSPQDFYHAPPCIAALIFNEMHLDILLQKKFHR